MSSETFRLLSIRRILILVVLIAATVAGFNPPAHAQPLSQLTAVNGCFSPYYKPLASQVKSPQTGTGEGKENNGKGSSEEANGTGVATVPDLQSGIASAAKEIPEKLEKDYWRTLTTTIDPGLAVLENTVKDGVAEQEFNYCNIEYMIDYDTKNNVDKDKISVLKSQADLAQKLFFFRQAEGIKLLRDREKWSQKVLTSACYAYEPHRSIDRKRLRFEELKKYPADVCHYLLKLNGSQSPPAPGAVPDIDPDAELKFLKNVSLAESTSPTVKPPEGAEGSSLTNALIDIFAPSCPDWLHDHKTPKTQGDKASASACATNLYGYASFLKTVAVDLPDMAREAASLEELTEVSLRAVARNAAAVFPVLDIAVAGIALGADIASFNGDQLAQLTIVGDALVLAGAIIAAVVPGIGAIIAVVTSVLAAFLRLIKYLIEAGEEELNKLHQDRATAYFYGLSQNLTIANIFNSGDYNREYVTSILAVDNGWPGQPIPTGLARAPIAVIADKYAQAMGGHDATPTFDTEDGYKTNIYYDSTSYGQLANVPPSGYPAPLPPNGFANTPDLKKIWQFMAGGEGTPDDSPARPIWRDLGKKLGYDGSNIKNMNFRYAGYLRMAFWYFNLQAVKLACHPRISLKGIACGGESSLASIGSLLGTGPVRLFKGSYDVNGDDILKVRTGEDIYGGGYFGVTNESDIATLVSSS